MRVIAGRFGGRTLKAPAGDATRPTGAKVKEALFSILGELSALRVLDLYAGSGALGIEALSRGAQSAVFVESARPALACLRENLNKLDVGDDAKLIPMRVEAARPQLSQLGPFDLVLCDPPWKDAAAALETLGGWAGAGLFSGPARLVLEHAAKSAFAAPAALEVVDERRWGDTAITIFGLAEPADVPGPSAPLT